MGQSIGSYIHIPFCIQRCHYCDFATYSQDQIKPNEAYVDMVLKEQKLRASLFKQRTLSTLYFGGGTPSLLSVHQIGRLIQGFKNNGFKFSPQIEISLEVNPATLTPEKCEGFKAVGINRISLGCQSFNDEYLKACNREHSSQDTRDTIELIQKHFRNFSLDLLFSLPQQRLSQLRSDLEEFKSFDPPHVSAYCLTLPSQHPMNQGRCDEQEQVQMFEMVHEHLDQMGLKRYEISNFSKPGFESKHNHLYWTDQSYWALGLSAHSYKKDPHWGYRFWNPSSYKAYMKTMENLTPTPSIEESFGPKGFEKLKRHESLTDFCHTGLRLTRGLDTSSIRHKFGSSLAQRVNHRLEKLKKRGWINRENTRWSLSQKGLLVSNQVFAELLFS